ncbi:Protein SMG9 [Choanephora cucurbitarum]|uniref:Protein SMG9 n=1 Tax=Choanephora cucurbitarum TaxID=101091 RepID=A0A1C7NS13_9FUNG|nr:Protein SMG9 [Choanephora cucurbitarum]
MSDKRSKEFDRRRDRRKNDSTNTPSFLQAPIILDRRECSEPGSTSHEPEKPKKSFAQISDIDAHCSYIPFMRRPNKFNTDAILKMLTDYPGHFAIGVIGKQGVGKSTILSHFAPNSKQVFPIQEVNQYLYQGHKTEGIDIHVTPERAILLDTEPILDWTVLDKALRTGNLGGLHPDLWLEMENLYNIIFIMSVCNVVLVLADGPEYDIDLLRLLQRAAMLKFNIPDFPLLESQQDMNYYPDIVFVSNKCRKEEFTLEKYSRLDAILGSFFQESQLRTKGLTRFSEVLPLFESDNNSNLFFLPDWSEKTQVESFDVLVCALRNQVFTAPRRSGRKGQVSEKDWYRNAVRVYELVRKSEYILEYLQVLRKLKDS